MPLIEFAEPGLRKVGKQAFHPRPRQVKSDDPNQIRRVEKARYSNIEDSFRLRVQRLVADRLASRVDDAELVKRFSSMLHEFQVRAYIQGKRVVGDLSNKLSDQDKRWLHGQHAQEMKWFRKFVADISSGSGKMSYQQRADLYGLSGHSVFLRGTLSTLPDTTGLRWLWIVNPIKEHCQDCLARQEQSKLVGGYSTEELLGKVGLPGEKTRCGNRCGCELRLVTGKQHLTRTRPTSFWHIKSLAEKRR